MQRRRRVSRKRTAEEEGVEEKEVVEEAEAVELVLEPKRARVEAAVQEAPRKKQAPTEWGSKQPKHVDKDILRYALTTGGELAQKQNQVGGEDDIEAIRANLFVEITEGEASLACDKRGSRVLQNLIKHAKSEPAIEDVAERLKPYIGHLAYEPFASHVIQSLVESAFCAQWKLDFCAQISKVDEWWAMMHHPSGTHVGRSLVHFLKQQQAVKSVQALLDSLMRGSQQDLSQACRNQAAGPFLSLVVSELLDSEQKALFAAKLLEDEASGEVNIRELEAVVMHPVGSRVMEVLTGSDCNHLWKPYAMDNLQRLVFHPIANFVAQRLVEQETDEEVMGRICTACPVSALLERDRVGVLNAILRGVVGFPALELRMRDDLVKVGIVDHAVTLQRPLPSASKRRHQQEEDTSTKMHAGLLETMHIVFTKFSPEARKPLASKVLALEAKQLLVIANDSLAGKRLLEPLLESEGGDEAFDLAKRFKTHFEALVLDRNGVFVAKKAFAVLKHKDRVKIMEEEIAPNEQKLNGAGTWGRTFLLAVKLNEFKVNVKEWQRKMDAEGAATAAAAARKPSETPKLSVKDAWKKELNL